MSQVSEKRWHYVARDFRVVQLDADGRVEVCICQNVLNGQVGQLLAAAPVLVETLQAVRDHLAVQNEALPNNAVLLRVIGKVLPLAEGLYP